MKLTSMHSGMQHCQLLCVALFMAMQVAVTVESAIPDVRQQLAALQAQLSEVAGDVFVPPVSRLRTRHLDVAFGIGATGSHRGRTGSDKRSYLKLTHSFHNCVTGQPFPARRPACRGCSNGRRCAQARSRPRPRRGASASW